MTSNDQLLKSLTMKKATLLFVLIGLVFGSCGTAKFADTDTQNEKTYNLPPNVNSNKYSKKRN